MSEIKVDTVAEKTSANGVTVDGLNIKDSKLVTANSVVTSNVTDGNITTAKILDDNVTYAKIQNVSATDRILGRDSSGAGVIEEITPANLRTMLNVADGATAGGGKLLQSSLTTANTEQTISSATFADLTGMTVNITPVSSTSVFLITAHLNVALLTTSGGSADIGFNSEILRDSTSVVNNAVTSSYGSIYYYQGNSNLHLFDTIVGVDDHNTSSQVTIKVVGREPDGNTCKFNLGGAKKSYLLVQEIET